MVTQKDIAEFLKLPRSTVTAALNDDYKSKRISAARRKLVKQTAKEMGYVVDDMARGIKTGRVKVFGLIGNNLPADFIDGVTQKADEYGYLLKILPINDDSVDKAVMQRLSAVILHMTSATISMYAQMLLDQRIHVAILGSIGRTLDNCINVATDNEQGTRLGLEHLYKLGHRKIAMLTGHMPSDAPARERAEAYLRFMKEKKLDPQLASLKTPQDLDSYEAIADAVKSLFASEANKPTAVMSYSARMLTTGIYAMREYRIYDVSVIGFGFNHFLSRGVTLVNEQHRKMGERIVELLLDQIKNEKFEYYREKFPAFLEKGISAKPVNDKFKTKI